MVHSEMTLDLLEDSDWQPGPEDVPAQRALNAEHAVSHGTLQDNERTAVRIHEAGDA